MIIPNGEVKYRIATIGRTVFINKLNLGIIRDCRIINQVDRCVRDQLHETIVTGLRYQRLTIVIDCDDLCPDFFVHDERPRLHNQSVKCNCADLTLDCLCRVPVTFDGDLRIRHLVVLEDKYPVACDW